MSTTVSAEPTGRDATELTELGGRVRRDADVSCVVDTFTITPAGRLVASAGWLERHSDADLARIYQLCW